MDKEKKRVEGIQAQQKATMARLETLLAQAKQRVGASNGSGIAHGSQE